jgi:hypothetical protein
VLLQSEEEREKIAVTEGQLFLKEIFSRQTILCLSHVKKGIKADIFTRKSVITSRVLLLLFWNRCHSQNLNHFRMKS